MNYSADSLRVLVLEKDLLAGQRELMLLQAGRLVLTSPKAKRFVLEGAMRRAKLVLRGIDEIFLRLPPELTGLPSEDDLSLATIFLHAQ